MKINYKITAWLFVVAIILLIVFYVFEFDYIGNTIGFESLIWKSLAAALILGVYLGYRFQNKGEEQVDKIRIWSASLLFPLFFAPWLGSLTNRLIPRGQMENKVFEYVEERPFAASAYGFLQGEEIKEDGCYLFVFYNGKIRRLKRPTCQFFNKNNGDEIILPVRKGLWGHEIIPWK